MSRPEVRTAPTNEFCVTLKERTPSHFNRYTIALPLHPSEKTVQQLRESSSVFPMDHVDLTVYTEQDLMQVKTVEELKGLIREGNPTETFPVMLLGGLLSDSSQFDRSGTSFIRKLTDQVRAVDTNKSYNPIYFGMSALGFSGSEVNAIDAYGPLDVGVRRYQTVLQTVMEELGFGMSGGALIGHSAGGAVVLEQAHTVKDWIPKVSLCPAIHLKKATQFDVIDKLLLLQENTIGPVPALRNWSSEKVVRELLGISLATPLKNLPVSYQEQIAMHVAELEAHRYATHMKLKELNIPLRRGIETVMSTLSVVGQKDILTPPSQIRVGFPDDFGGFVTVPHGSHDDIFIREEVQTMVIPVIANYLRKRIVDYDLVKSQGLVL